MSSSACTRFNFLASYEAKGIEQNADGILGLSPNRDPSNHQYHLLHQLKASGLISESLISFSIASADQGEQPYAIFGGVNEQQIVGGLQGIMTAKVFANNLNTWALEG
jgi:hypothetical protein